MSTTKTKSPRIRGYYHGTSFGQRGRRAFPEKWPGTSSTSVLAIATRLVCTTWSYAIRVMPFAHRKGRAFGVRQGGRLVGYPQIQSSPGIKVKPQATSPHETLMEVALTRLVWLRANHCCEYCQ